MSRLLRPCYTHTPHIQAPTALPSPWLALPPSTNLHPASPLFDPLLSNSNGYLKVHLRCVPKSLVKAHRLDLSTPGDKDASLRAPAIIIVSVILRDWQSIAPKSKPGIDQRI